MNHYNDYSQPLIVAEDFYEISQSFEEDTFYNSGISLLLLVVFTGGMAMSSAKTRRGRYSWSCSIYNDSQILDP
jgi:hypothetical protein